MVKVISFGHRCSSAYFIQSLNLKTESYPFDYLVSKLDVIKDCIETKFIHFLNVNNYITQEVENYNMIDDKKVYIRNDIAHVNLNYEKIENINLIPKNNYKLSLTHRNLNEHQEYYQRCVNRLYDLFNMDVKKYYIYTHPILGINDYNKLKENILDEYDDFNNFLLNQTTNIFGLYFILVKQAEDVKSIKIKETLNYDVFLIYCNDDFIDGGTPFMGNFDVETEEIKNILKNYFI